jgi:ribosomal protein L24
MQKTDRIYVISITDKEKHYLKGEYTPDQIAKKYKTILLSNVSFFRKNKSKYTESHYKIVLQEKDYRSSIRTDILKVCEEIAAHFLFFGYHGRKGPKE